MMALAIVQCLWLLPFPAGSYLCDKIICSVSDTFVDRYTHVAMSQATTIEFASIIESASQDNV